VDDRWITSDFACEAAHVNRSDGEVIAGLIQDIKTIRQRVGLRVSRLGACTTLMSLRPVVDAGTVEQGLLVAEQLVKDAVDALSEDDRQLAQAMLGLAPYGETTLRQRLQRLPLPYETVRGHMEGTVKELAYRLYDLSRGVASTTEPSELEADAAETSSDRGRPNRSAVALGEQVAPPLGAVPPRELQDELVGAFLRSQDPDFFSHVAALIPQAHDMVLVSSGLNLIWNKHILTALLKRAATPGCQLTICLANPYSPYLQDRWIEEQMELGPQFGRDAMADNIASLLGQVSDAGAELNVKVLLFEHYPTLATLIFDDDVFVYPYAYQLLGNLSPIIHLRRAVDGIADFFIDNAERVLADAVDAKDVILAHADRRYWSIDWVEVLVGLLPDSDSAMYERLSGLTGYDVRTNAEILEASDAYGLAVSCGGTPSTLGAVAVVLPPLMYASPRELGRIEAETEALTRDLPTAVLSDPKVNLDDTGALWVDYAESSGAAEVLNAELARNVARSAISSRPLLAQAKGELTSLSRRDAFILDRYGATEMLGSSTPRVPLWSNLELPTKARVAELLGAAKAEVTPKNPDRVRVSDVAVLLRRQREHHWRIHSTSTLRG
jgi:hypothetical protein